MRRFNPPKFSTTAVINASEVGGMPERHLASYTQKAPGRGKEAREPLRERDTNSSLDALTPQYYKILYTKRNINKVGL
jgi:hypothetical protein